MDLLLWMAVINQTERKLAKRTSVYCNDFVVNTPLMNYPEHRLKKHYRDHHSDKPIDAAGFTKFNCDLCKEFFFAKNSLDVHLNRKHGIDNGIVEPEKRRFHCTQCPGNYYSYQALRNHIVRAHDGIRQGLLLTTGRCSKN